MKAENDLDELEDEIEGIIGNLLSLSDEKWRKKYEGLVRDILKAYNPQL